MRHSFVTTSLLVTLAACSGNSQPPPAQGKVDAASASATVARMHDVVTAMSSTDASGAASAVMSLTAAGQAVVVPSQPTSRAAIGRMPSAWSHPIGESFTGSASCTATTCTYNGFGDVTPSGSYQLDGTITRSGNMLVFNLTFTVTTANMTVDWALDGQVTVTAQLIDGSLHEHGTTTASGSNAYAATWDIQLDYNAIGLDGSACPVSGSLDATVSYTVSGAATGGYTAQGSAAFGPACGDVH